MYLSRSILRRAAVMLRQTAAARTLSTASTTASSMKVSQPAMFCRQCEQTSDHYACVNVGVCGKTSETANIQDALIAQIKSVAHWMVAAKKNNVDFEILAPIHQWTLGAAFSTLTNVNFSSQRIAEYIALGEHHKETLKSLVSEAPPSYQTMDLANKSLEDLEEFGLSVSVPKRADAMGNEDAFSLNEIGTYGLKVRARNPNNVLDGSIISSLTPFFQHQGVCAYKMHCSQLGVLDEEVVNAVQEIWSKLDSPEPDVQGLLKNALRVGEINARVLQLLDQAHADNFGNPEPTQVRMTAVEGKCILISGHDMMDCYELLKQTEGKNINVYTHGEMFPAHSYPKLKAFPHLVGNYGTAWQNQKFEFAAFPGPVVVTTNCIQEPRKMYRDRLFSINEVGVDNVQHVENRDFSAVIAKAQECKGFPKTFEPGQFMTVGFNHRVVLPLADKVLQAASSGALSRIFLIGGCDGSQWERNYFTDLAEKTPSDSLILTLGCAKNRIIHSEKLQNAMLGDTGIPRVLDMGQCNDSYSAVVVATELAKALKCGVNDLPLSLALSHLEQKAAAVLLTLLSMGVKNIRLGPSLPAYVSPNVFSILQQNYNLMGTNNQHPEEDLKMMMEGK